MNEVNVTINGIAVKVASGSYIVDAANVAGFRIPTLCYHPDVPPTGACGLCIVRNDNGKLIRSCTMKVQEGKNYITHDNEINAIRKTIIEEILAEHPRDCLECRRNENCELQHIAAKLNVRRPINFSPNIKERPIDDSCAVVYDTRYCIHCNRCVQICDKIQNVRAIEIKEMGKESHIAPVGGGTLAQSPCIKCGQCAAHCPVNAIKEKEDRTELSTILHNKKHFVTVQIAPAVRVSLGEDFRMPAGTLVTGKIYAALRRLGFNAIFDTNFGADMTVMEEAHELIERLKTGQKLPLITTCCPSWVEFMERFHADMIEHFSSCKSPMMMTGLLTKSYYAQKHNINPATIFNVAVMPCTAKKEEIMRPELLGHSPYNDVDLVITTRELARMIKEAGINFNHLPDEQSDDLLGNYSGAGVIFGTTGGVMEAALRTAAHFTGTKLDKLEFDAIRGMEDIKETTINLGGQQVRIAVTHGTRSVEAVLEKVREALAKGQESPWHFIEVMACKGGCVSGGGQIYTFVHNLRESRAAGLYIEDRAKSKRASHENESVQEVYQKFFDGIGSQKAHKLLHTHYTARPYKPTAK
jgi:NADH-quinone oxidoreductase subunit G